MSDDGSSQVHWRDWSDEAFEEAQRDDKLVLLDIEASWCHWCHVMDRTTYSNQEVIRIVNEKFIPVRVDADKRPDVQDRYLLGGWPTTAFLVPDGRILSGTTFVPPEAMIYKLEEMDNLYHQERSTVMMQVTSMEAEAEADRTAAETTVGKLDGELIKALTETMEREFDPVNGGFGDEPKFPYPDGMHFAFLQYRRTRDKKMLDIALKTLEGMMRLSDPVWGGFYRYGMKADWTQAHFEKLLYVQAGILDNYLEAYQVTGDDKFGEVAASIKSYVSRLLSDSEHGGFYAGQDADIGSHDPNADLVSGEDYFSRGEQERLKIGIPYVDKTIYTDWNGMMISSYLRLYHVMGDEHARDFALKTVDRLLSESMREGQMYHYSDGEPKVPGILSDQVYFAQALADTYQSTGERKCLEGAEKLVNFMQENLQDVVDGGFYFRTFDPHARGEMLERHKPFDENAAAARLLLELSYMTGNEAYRDTAERTLRAIAYPQITETIIGLGFGNILELLTHHPIHVVLVGNRNDKQTQEMLETSLHAYEPEKLVQLLDPSEDPLTIGESTYEAEKDPVAYVCVQNVCRPPAKGPEELATVLEDVLGGTA